MNATTSATTNEAAYVVVGVDGSPASDRAVDWAAHYAATTGKALKIVAAWAWPRMYGIQMVVDGLDLPGLARDCAARAAKDCGLPVDRLQVVVLEGPAGPALVEQSAAAELLVLGSHSYGAVSAALVGSVSTYCLHHAKTPVVIVR